jgi:hypothetical protein
LGWGGRLRGRGGGKKRRGTRRWRVRGGGWRGLGGRGIRLGRVGLGSWGGDGRSGMVESTTVVQNVVPLVESEWEIVGQGMLSEGICAKDEGEGQCGEGDE